MCTCDFSPNNNFKGLKAWDPCFCLLFMVSLLHPSLSLSLSPLLNHTATHSSFLHDLNLPTTPLCAKTSELSLLPIPANPQNNFTGETGWLILFITRSLPPLSRNIIPNELRRAVIHTEVTHGPYRFTVITQTPLVVWCTTTHFSMDGKQIIPAKKRAGFFVFFYPEIVHCLQGPISVYYLEMQLKIAFVFKCPMHLLFFSTMTNTNLHDDVMDLWHC